MNPSEGAPGANSPAIEVVDLRFDYPGGHVALAGASFEVRTGETAVLMGANGVGKSTLLLCVVGVQKGIGLVRVEGIELNPESVASIRKRIGFVSASPKLIS